MDEYRPGKGCCCYARSESDCCCDDVDWRSAREVELEAEVERLRETLGEIVEWVERWTSGDHPVANVAKKALQQSGDTAGGG